MRRVLPFVTVGLLLLAAADPLFAQQRLFALTPHELVELDPNLSSLGRIIRRVPAPDSLPSERTGPVPVAGGALLAWTVGGRVVLYNIQNGSLRQYDVPGYIVGRLLGTSADSFSVLLEGDSLVGSGRKLITADVRDGSVRELDLGTSVGDVVYAPLNDLLFVEKSSDPPANYVEVRRAGDGALLRTIPLASGTGFRLAVNASGTRLFAHNMFDGLFAFDVASGGLLAQTPGYSLSPEPRLIVDEARQRLLFWSGFSEPFLIALYFDTLQPIGRASLPPVAPAYLSDVAVDVSPVSATIFAIQNVFIYNWEDPNVCQPSRFIAMNVDTGEMRKTVDLTSVTGDVDCQVNLVRVTEPNAPVNFAANVAGSRVDLSWSPVAALRYEIEAGSAPGLTNLATLTVADNRLTIDGVPPGVYHLRIRGINTIGKSGASQEIRVVVQ